MRPPVAVTFVVPCFNEEDNVAATVDTIGGAMTDQSDYEVVLVDDCSTDRTLERMRALAQAEPRIQVVHNPINLGLGGSYKRGVAVAQGRCVMMVPGDNGFPAESIAEILRHIGHADIVIPVVMNSGARTWFRAMTSRCFTVLLNWIFWLDVGYYNGAVLHQTARLRTINIKTNGFAYQAEALVKLIARGATYTQCRVRIQERATGRSTALGLKNQISVVKTIVHLLVEVGVLRKFRIGSLHRPRRSPRAALADSRHEHERYDH
jgi:glycosyltransferase involved in cell wall biosynthesis